MQALGYEYDSRYGFSKTSIIDLRSDLGRAEVYLDGEKVSERLPYEIEKVPLGVHEISIRKTGYRPKNFRAEVREGIVTKVENVVLLPTAPIVFPLDFVAWDKDKTVFLRSDKNGAGGQRITAFGPEGESKIRSLVGIESDFDCRFFAAATIACRKGDLFYLFEPETSLPKVYRREAAAGATTGEIQTWDYLPEQESYLFLTADELLSVDFKQPPRILAAGVKGYWRSGEKVALKTAEEVKVLDLRTGQFSRSWAYAREIKSALVLENNVLVWTVEGELNLLTDEAIRVIETDVNSVTDVSGAGDILLLKNDGEIYLHNLDGGKKKFITRYGSSDLKVEWYRDAGSFWLFAKNEVRICAVSGGHCDLLFDGLEDFPHYYRGENALLLRKQGFQLHFIDDGKEKASWWSWT